MTVGACHGYLLVCQPEGLANVGVGSDRGIGFVFGDTVAFLRPDDIHVAGTDHVKDRLRALFAEWEQIGRPDHRSLQPHLTEEPDGFGMRLG